jgi:hypothetical protein
VTRHSLPRQARARHAMDREHERTTFAPAYERRGGAVVERDAVTCG